MKTIGILYHPKLDEAKRLSERLAKSLPSLGYSVWFGSAWEEEAAKKQLDKSELILSIGGDGTVLRTARVILPHSIPILGINMGRLGFMTELSSDEAEQKLPALLSKQGWIDERTMLQARSISSGQTSHALNDVVIGRGAVVRTINVDVNVEGVDFTSHRVDAIILATATGSTAYALAAGGPILYPDSQNILLQPVATHMKPGYGMVLPATVTIELTIHTYSPGLLSIDGQINHSLEDGEQVEVKRSPYTIRFLRFKPRLSFYNILAQRLVGK